MGGGKRDRKLRTDLYDDCRSGDHRACGHVGAGGGLRASYVLVCSCRCHEDCPALGAPADEMGERCNCLETGTARQRLAQRIGIKYRRQWEIRRGSPESPEGESVVSVSFLILLVAVLALFIGSIVVAARVSGPVSYLAIALAVVTGLWLLWTAVLLVLMRIILALITHVRKTS